MFTSRLTHTSLSPGPHYSAYSLLVLLIACLLPGAFGLVDSSDKAAVAIQGTAAQLPQAAYTAPGASTRNTGETILTGGLRRRIDALRQKWDVPGLTIGLAASPEFAEKRGVAREVGDEWVLETAGFGTADRFGDAVDENTLFAIASNSKLFTVTAVGLLIHNNTKLPNGETLGWSTKIKDILPEWKLMDEYASNQVDLIDLMSMRSGLPRHDGAKGESPPSKIIANMRYLKPSAELRQAWQYNNLHYVTLSHIIPTLTNISFDAYVRANIFEPIGLTSTRLNATAALESGHRSDGFLRVGRNLTACNVEWKAKGEVGKECLGEAGSIGWWTDGDSLFEAGPGGVTTSAKDMAKWVKELLHPQILPADLIAKTTTTITIPSGKPDYPEQGITTYGLGQWAYTYRGYTIHGHTGSVPGQRSIMIRVPDLGFGFMCATNDDDFGSALVAIVANEVLDELLGLEKIDWEGRMMGKEFELPVYPAVPDRPRTIPKGVEGTYQNAGYGGLELVKVKPPGKLATDALLAPIHALTAQTASVPLNLTGPIFVAQINKTFVSHLIFTHFDGPLFNWTAVYVVDKLEGNSTVGSIGKVEQTGTVVVAEHGLGFFGDLWGKGATVEGSHFVETGVAEAAEVWFEGA
ncbi:hypothetical protein IAT38_003324 [Cryptococcus sp. DSM 104549]